MNTIRRFDLITEPKEKTCLPQAVVEKAAVEGKSLVRAWREYRNMSQEEIAQRMGVTQPAYNVLEETSNIISNASIKRIAAALGVSEIQLRI